MKTYTPAFDTHAAPAGNLLRKRDESMGDSSWTRVTVEVIHAGQPRPYADYYYEYLLTFEGGCNSTISGYDSPFGWKKTETKVRDVARAMCRPFKDEPENWASTICQLVTMVKETEFYQTWKIVLTEAYTG